MYNDIIVFNEETHVYEIHVPLTDNVDTNTIDDTEKAPEKDPDQIKSYKQAWHL